MLVLHEASPRLLINPRKIMTVIKFLLFIIAHGSIEPRLFVACFFVMFPRTVSSFHPSTVRLIFIHGVVRVGIIKSKEKESC